MCDVFISYSSRDYAEARSLRLVLEKNGISCWMAPEDIPGGSNYAAEIPNAIQNCNAFILVLTNAAQQSIWVTRELDMAVQNRKVILPVLLEDCPLIDEFNFYLIGAQWYTAYEKRSEVLEQLVQRIHAISGDTLPLKREKTATRSPEGSRKALRTAALTGAMLLYASAWVAFFLLYTTAEIGNTGQYKATSVWYMFRILFSQLVLLPPLLHTCLWGRRPSWVVGLMEKLAPLGALAGIFAISVNILHDVWQTSLITLVFPALCYALITLPFTNALCREVRGGIRSGWLSFAVCWIGMILICLELSHAMTVFGSISYFAEHLDMVYFDFILFDLVVLILFAIKLIDVRDNPMYSVRYCGSHFFVAFWYMVFFYLTGKNQQIDLMVRFALLCPTFLISGLIQLVAVIKRRKAVKKTTQTATLPIRVLSTTQAADMQIGETEPADRKPVPEKETEVPMPRRDTDIPVYERVQRWSQESAFVINNSGSYFAKGKLHKIREGFPLPEDARIILAHDDSLRKNGKVGYAICHDGIYVKELFDQVPTFVKWEQLRGATEVHLQESLVYAVTEQGEFRIGMYSIFDKKKDKQMFLDMLNAIRE